MDRNSSASEPDQVELNSSEEGDAGASAQPTGSSAVQKAKAVAGDLAERARSLVEEQVSGAAQKAADRIGGVADALQATGDELHSQGAGDAGNFVDQAVDKLDEASAYLQSSTFDDLASDIGDYARREPAIVFGAAFVLGLLASRFLKSSSSATALHYGDRGIAGTTGLDNSRQVERSDGRDRETELLGLASGNGPHASQG